MAEFIIRNSLNPHKVVKCTITFRQIVNKGDEGEPVWVLELGTSEPHKDGGVISSVFVHYTSAKNVDAAINDAVAQISEQIDWTPLTKDLRAPFVTYYYPDSDVAEITSNVSVIIKDIMPAAGIDINSINMTINGYDVTDDIEILGNAFEYSITWSPPWRVYETE